MTAIDTEATIEKNPVDMAEIKKDLLTFIADYQAEGTEGKGYSHYVAIQSVQKIQGRIMGDSTC